MAKKWKERFQQFPSLFFWKGGKEGAKCSIILQQHRTWWKVPQQPVLRIPGVWSGGHPKNKVPVPSHSTPASLLPLPAHCTRKETPGCTTAPIPPCKPHPINWDQSIPFQDLHWGPFSQISLRQCFTYITYLLESFLKSLSKLSSQEENPVLLFSFPSLSPLLVWNPSAPSCPGSALAIPVPFSSDMSAAKSFVISQIYFCSDRQQCWPFLP